MNCGGANMKNGFILKFSIAILILCSSFLFLLPVSHSDNGDGFNSEQVLDLSSIKQFIDELNLKLSELDTRVEFLSDRYLEMKMDVSLLEKEVDKLAVSNRSDDYIETLKANLEANKTFVDIMKAVITVLIFILSTLGFKTLHDVNKVKNAMKAEVIEIQKTKKDIEEKQLGVNITMEEIKLKSEAVELNSRGISDKFNYIEIEAQKIEGLNAKYASEIETHMIKVKNYSNSIDELSNSFDRMINSLNEKFSKEPSISEEMSELLSKSNELKLSITQELEEGSISQLVAKKSENESEFFEEVKGIEFDDKDDEKEELDNIELDNSEDVENE